MQILYGFSNCTDSTYNRIVSERNVSTMVPDQKYHGLLIKGLAHNGAEVRCFSGLPVNRAVTSRKLVREKDEREGNAYYHYITTINLPVIRQLMIFFGTFFRVLRAKKDKDTYDVCDCLNLASAYGMTLACRMRKIPVVSIITDLPEYTKNSFPSKNMEYMVSRTPIMTTKLPGMPEKYDPYVYFIEDESPDGIANVLRKVIV